MAQQQPVYLTRKFRPTEWGGYPNTYDLLFSDDGVLTKKGLKKILKHFRRLNDCSLYMHPSWYQGDIPKDVSVRLWDGMLQLGIKLDYIPCSPQLMPNMIYKVPKNLAHMFVEGSILDRYYAAIIDRNFVNPNCIFSLLKKGIIPYLGNGFIVIRRADRSPVFCSEISTIFP